VIDALFYFLFSEKKKPTAEQIKKYLEEKKGIKTSERLVRYHLQKLIDMHIIERKNSCYCINAAPNAEREDFVAALEYHLRTEFEQTIKQIILGIGKLVEKYEG
ncbi:MAG: winged-helix domain-containing protein, partial [Candidatus Diapherotrites archaeon]